MSVVAPLVEARLPLPPVEQAAGIRDFLRGQAEFNLKELVTDWGLVTPREGAGVVREYFTLHRLCDATTQITDDTWAPLLAHPPIAGPEERRVKPGGEPQADWREQARRQAARLEERDAPGGALAALSLKLATLRVEEMPAFLTAQAPLLFESLPEGSLWYVSVDPVLIHRLAVMRGLVAYELTPDIITAKDFPGLRALEEHSLTAGLRSGPLYDVLLTTFAPAAFGYVCEMIPNSLILLHGFAANLSLPWPATPSTLYQPHIQGEHGVGWLDETFYSGVSAAESEALLRWWTERLNVVYSHIADPTRFVDANGNHQPTRQRAWFLTFERLLADTLLVTTGFQSPPLARQQSAFDLLDKAESLLGFASDKSGKGFERMFRRSSMQRRLTAISTTLPTVVSERFRQHGDWLYESLYADVREHVVPARLTKSGVMVGPPGKLVNRPMESYVPELVRSVRNSAHGFEQLSAHVDRFLVATHDGKLPAQLPDLAALITFALIADAEALQEGRWLPPA
jgi:hypothetical protein